MRSKVFTVLFVYSQLAYKKNFSHFGIKKQNVLSGRFCGRPATKKLPQQPGKDRKQQELIECGRSSIFMGAFLLLYGKLLRFSCMKYFNSCQYLTFQMGGGSLIFWNLKLIWKSLLFILNRLVCPQCTSQICQNFPNSALSKFAGMIRRSSTQPIVT